MVVAAIAHEITLAVSHRGELLGLKALRVIADIGDAKTEQIGVEAIRRVHIHHVEAEVAESADFERSIEQHAADIEFRLCFHRLITL